MNPENKCSEHVGNKNDDRQNNENTQKHYVCGIKLNWE